MLICGEKILELLKTTSSPKIFNKGSYAILTF